MGFYCNIIAAIMFFLAVVDAKVPFNLVAAGLFFLALAPVL